jgi:hypothetical protein
MNLMSIKWEDPRLTSEEEYDESEAWLSQCGEFIEDGCHCPGCGEEPPWGCPCNACQDGEDEEDYSSDGVDFMEMFP